MRKPQTQIAHPLCYIKNKTNLATCDERRQNTVKDKLAIGCISKHQSEVIYLQRNSTSALSDSPTAPRHNRKWLLFATRKRKNDWMEIGPLLGSQVARCGAEGCFPNVASVCGNQCTMGWPWDGRLCIISSAPIRRNGWRLRTFSSAGGHESSPGPSPAQQLAPTQPETWWSKVTFCPVWQHSVVKGRWAQSAASSGSSYCDKTLPLNIYGLSCRKRNGGHSNVTPLISVK